MLPRLAALLFLLPGPLQAEGLPVTWSDWGGTGLLESPTARFAADGSLSVGASVVAGARVSTAIAYTLTPGLEMTARQTLLSRGGLRAAPSIDVKMRLWPEGEFWPALAFGVRNLSGEALTGTDRVGGAFIVASRRWWSIDASAGLGWDWRSGSAALATPPPLFGGIEWHTPLKGLSLKLEYADDRVDGGTLPLNAGLDWRPASWLDLGVGLEQGERLMCRLTAVLGPEMMRGRARTTAAPALGRARPALPTDAATEAELLGVTRAQGVAARSVQVDRSEAAIWIDAPADRAPARDVGRAARVLAVLAPPSADTVTVMAGRNGAAETAVALNRDDVLRAAAGAGSPEEIARTAEWSRPRRAPSSWAPALSVTADAVIEQSLFEHGMSSVYRAFSDVSLRAEPLRGVFLSAGTRIRIADNLDWLDTATDAPSRPVRSDLPAYAARRIGLEHAEVSWLGDAASGLAVRLSGGLMEEMLAGVSAEALYRPFEARWAIGVTADRVWKRSVSAIAGFGGAPLTSVLLTAAWEPDSDRDWQASLAAGRYLGGDWGGTIAFGRLLTDDVRLAAHATATGAVGRERSALGGAFDAGVTLTVFLDGGSRLPVGSRVINRIATLGRDGGQRLNSRLSLIDETRASGRSRLLGSWSHLLD